MASFGVIEFEVRFPDVAPADLDTLAEVEASVPFDPELRARLLHLRDRIARMLLTIEVGRGG